MREDVLLPIEVDGVNSWRIVEVKASTKLKPEHIQDCAAQAWVHLQSGYPLSRISLAHINNQFVYPGDGDYEGLFIEHDVTEQVFELLPAVPVWIERAPGVMGQAEFLDLSGEPPMRALAEHMVVALETAGPVLMYTTYEHTVIQGLIGLFPDLADALQAIDARLVDLHPITCANYYHPDMLGSWSIKAVLPTIVPHMDYALLDGIQEGMAASNAYLEAIHPQTSAERKEEIRHNLLKYCKNDTEAMVRLVGFFAGAAGSKVVGKTA